MNAAGTIAAITSGLIAFISAVWVIGRGIFSQIAATKDLTGSIRALQDELGTLNTSIRNIDSRVSKLEGVWAGFHRRNDVS